jgi:hypothetical protein
MSPLWADFGVTVFFAHQHIVEICSIIYNFGFTPAFGFI